MKIEKLLVSAYIIIIFLLPSCGYQTNDANMKNSNEDMKKFSGNLKGESNQVVINPNANLDSKSFYAQDKDNLQSTDFETIYEMCKSLLSEYYYAKANGANIDFSKYISNDNLLVYSQKKTLEESYASTIKDISFGIAKAELHREGYFYLLVIAEVSGDGNSRTSEGTEFLVKNLGGRLVISDWYTPHGTLSYYDDKIRNEASIKLVDGWENEDYVSKVFLKAEIIEAEKTKNDFKTIIDNKLDSICNNNNIKVQLSSNPYDYTKDNQDYKDIVNLGDNALKYMLTEFENNKENQGLREYIMAIACSEILKESIKTKRWETGREWYYNYTKSIK